MVGDDCICEVAEGGCFVVQSGLARLFFGQFLILFLVFGEVFDGIHLVISEEFEYFFIGFVEMFEDVFLSEGGIVEVIFGEKFEEAFVYFFDKL